MKPSTLFNSDDRAVSPVIGVILMVAITVILAAVIGTFVLGLGDSLGDSQPTAQLDTDFDSDANNVTISHNGGDSIEGDDLRVTFNGSDSSDQFPPGQFEVGESVVIDDDTNATAGARLRIIHEPSDSILLDRVL
jgi:flagellin-like protein